MMNDTWTIYVVIGLCSVLLGVLIGLSSRVCSAQRSGADSRPTFSAKTPLSIGALGTIIKSDVPQMIRSQFEARATRTVAAPSDYMPPTSFDLRLKYPGLIGGPTDQGACNSYNRSPPAAACRIDPHDEQPPEEYDPLCGLLQAGSIKPSAHLSAHGVSAGLYCDLSKDPVYSSLLLNAGNCGKNVRIDPDPTCFSSPRQLGARL